MARPPPRRPSIGLWPSSLVVRGAREPYPGRLEFDHRRRMLGGQVDQPGLRRGPVLGQQIVDLPHDRPEHLCQRRYTYRLRKAAEDPFLGPYPLRFRRGKLHRQQKVAVQQRMITPSYPDGLQPWLSKPRQQRQRP